MQLFFVSGEDANNLLFLGVLKNEILCIAIKTNKALGIKISIILTNTSYRRLFKLINHNRYFDLYAPRLYIELFNEGKKKSLSATGCPLGHFSQSQSFCICLNWGHFRNSSQSLVHVNPACPLSDSLLIAVLWDTWSGTTVLISQGWKLILRRLSDSLND